MRTVEFPTKVPTRALNTKSGEVPALRNLMISKLTGTQGFEPR